MKERENLWLRPEQPARGPRPRFGRAEMTRAAIAIADAEGLAALSMRRLAADLDAGPMSPYSYITGKDELIELMVDAVTAEFLRPDGAACGDWRTELRGLARRMRSAMHRHPWLAEIGLRRQAASPNRIRLFEQVLGVLDALELSMDAMLTTMIMIFVHVYGFVQIELADQEAQRRTGLELSDWMRRQLPYIESVVSAGDHPMFARMTAEAGRTLTGFDERWEYGLERLLDSIQGSAGGRRAAGEAGSPV
ncbi:TetR/AcrR family transcriptional regulator C-terminal domain-containing protein [Actinoallomurus sp. NBC_01490]|uniref:TetR/AcrR family transcriptional regulator n=1 Tax=Actinoallomurus sp. NBC_01490 TaxID=2903557 RepID=UPI002E318824|nr:TetR/AcrR family transcriptional regulator C-terminal domain-containing protein [Actinoallomurus sp. NBC_01490]